MNTTKLEDIVSLCKRRGFIYPGSDVYGGLSGTWDYGPLGVALKRNVMQLWWKMFVDERDDMLGVDAAILMNQKVWQASGHVDTFTDPLVECGVNGCNTRYRLDHLVEHFDESRLATIKNAVELTTGKIEKFKDWPDLPLDEQDYVTQRQRIRDVVQDSLARLVEAYEVTDETTKLLIEGAIELYFDDIVLIYKQKKMDDNKSLVEYLHKDKSDLVIRLYLILFVKCNNPKCKGNNWSLPRLFNMMLKTSVGPVQNDGSVSYLRPETAQGIFTNFKNVVDSFYPDMPFGLAQQGKAFRNEISPRDFVFRSREFEQMEIEYFVHPDQWESAFEAWVKQVHEWCDALGLPKDMVHELEVPEEDRAHYSKRTIDFEFDFPIGREELLGLAYRTDFDLQNIQRVSGKSMEYRPKDGGEAFVPHVIEPSFGLERAIMAVLTAAYWKDEANERIVLKLPKHLAPVKVAVSPLLKNKPELVNKAREVYSMLKKEFGAVMWDDNGNIGKRYRRQDEIGTPYCVVVDFDTLEDGAVTVRDRDTTEQTRVAITGVIDHVSA